jgi:hypothetical protein
MNYNENKNSPVIDLDSRRKFVGRRSQAGISSRHAPPLPQGFTTQINDKEIARRGFIRR